MIRRANEGDLSQLLELGRISAEEFGEDFSYPQAVAYINLSLNDYQSTCPLVIDNDQELQGYLIGTIVKGNFSERITGVECHWYVLPNHRKTRESLKLLQAFEGWSQSKGVKSLLISSGKDPRLEKVLSRMGYEVKSKIMEKSLKATEEKKLWV